MLVYIGRSRSPVKAEGLLRRVLESCRQHGDRGDEGDALRSMSQVQRGLENPARARDAIDNALVIAREHENRAWEAHWLIEFGKVQVDLGQVTEALESYHRSATLQRRLGDRSREAIALDAAGEAYRELQRFEEAIEFHRLAVSTHRALGERTVPGAGGELPLLIISSVCRLVNSLVTGWPAVGATRQGDGAGTVFLDDHCSSSRDPPAETAPARAEDTSIRRLTQIPQIARIRILLKHDGALAIYLPFGRIVKVLSSLFYACCRLTGGTA